MHNGTLYIVATPIGTLGDISPRAVEVLRSVDFIICEDTRHSHKLLQHYNIHTPTTSLHEHNEKNKTQSLIERIRLAPKQSAAIITDAGTPCISDPGSYFIHCAHEAGIRVLSVPGPSALPAALAACGFYAPRFLFAAFLPRDKKEQLKEFELWQKIMPCLVVFYESPKRLKATLKNLEHFFGSEIKVCASKELSKIFETHYRGSLAEVQDQLETLDMCGEWAVVLQLEKQIISGISKATTACQNNDLNTLKEQSGCKLALQELILRSQQPEAPKIKELCKVLSKKYGISSSELYRLYISNNDTSNKK